MLRDGINNTLLIHHRSDLFLVFLLTVSFFFFSHLLSRSLQTMSVQVAGPLCRYYFFFRFCLANSLFLTIDILICCMKNLATDQTNFASSKGICIIFTVRTMKS